MNYSRALERRPQWSPDKEQPLADDPREHDRLRMLFDFDDPVVEEAIRERASARLAEARAALIRTSQVLDDGFVEIGSKWRLEPFLILGPSTWDSPHYGLLGYALDLTPYDDWNVIWLAPNPVAAIDMRIQVVPQDYPLALTQATEQLLRRLDPEWEEAFSAARQSGEVRELAQTSDRLRAAIKAFAAQVRLKFDWAGVLHLARI